MSMQSPRNLREWQQAVERNLKAAKNGTRMAISHADDKAEAVKGDLSDFKALTPTSPVTVTYSTSTYIDQNRKRRGKVIADFPDVTLSTTAVPITVERYEIAGQDQGVNPLEPFRSMGTSDISSVVTGDLAPGSVWKFKVRALSGSTVKSGLWSTEQTVTITNDTTPPPVPSQPVVTAVSGGAKVVWDGLAAGGGAMPGDFDRVEVAYGLSSSPTTVVDTFYAASLLIQPKSAYNVPHYFRLRAFDTTGNASAWSVQGVAIPVPLVDVDLILSKIDAATTEITNIGASAILSGAITTAKLADNAISQAKLQDQIVSLAKLDTTTNAKITQGITDAAAAASSAVTANNAAGTAQAAADKAQAVVDAKIAAGATLNINGNFDSTPITSPPLGWPSRQLAVVQASSTTARSGANVLKCSPTTATISYGYTDYVASAAGRTFYVEYWVRLDQTLIAANANLLVGALFSTLDTAGNGVANPQYGSSAGGAAYPQVKLSDLSTTAWTKFAVTYTIPQANNVQTRFGPRIPNLVTAGNTFEVDGFRVVDMTEAQSALDAAATAQAKADTAFANAQTALTNAGLAQTAANGKNSNYYSATAPAGNGYKDNDTWFKSPKNTVYRWNAATTAWVSIQDTDIAGAQAAADSAASAAAIADGKAAAAQTKANQAFSDAAAAKTAGDNAAAAAAVADGKAATAQTAANNAASAASAAQTAGDNAASTAIGMANISTSPAPGTLAAAPGAIWQQVDVNNSDRIIGTWVAGNDKVWRTRVLQDAVLGSINALKITTGTMSAARVDAAEMRAAILTVGKITANDIVTGTITAASGIIGSLDANKITTGTMDVARLNAGDVRAAIITVGKITASEMVAGTITVASGVIGSLDANKISAGTLDAARLNAGDVRAAIISAGKIAAVDMVTGTITATSGIIGSLDIGKVTTGTMSGSFITANTIGVKHLMVSDLANYAPSLGESIDDWTLSGGLTRVTSGLDVTGYRFNVADNASNATGYGPYMAVKTGDSLYGYTKIYRGAGTTQNAYLRFYWYDKDKAALGTPFTEVPNGGPNTGGTGAVMDGAVTVPALAAYSRFAVVLGPGAGNSGFYAMQGYRQNGAVLIQDGAIISEKVATNAITARNIIIGDFANLALGSDFEDANAVPWTLDAQHVISTAQKKSGTSSLRMTANAGTDKSIFTGDLRVKEGEQWYFKYHAYIDATFNGTTNSTLRIGDQNNVSLGVIPYNGITRSAWTTLPLEAVITVPAGVTSLRVELWSDNTAGTAYIDDIQIRRMSEASLIQNLGVEKLTASAASIQQATIDKLWAEVVRAKKITTDMMIVGRGVNGIIDEYFELADVKTNRHALAGSWGAWAVSGNGLNVYTQPTLPGTASKSFYFDVASSAYDKTSYIPVEPGQKWRLSMMFTSSGAGPRATGRFIKRDGTTGYTSAYWTMRDGSANAYETPGTLKVMERIMTVPADVAYFVPAVQFDTAATSATIYGGTTFTNMATSSLVVDGAITARNLTVDDTLWAKVIKFKMITGDEIDVNTIVADTLKIGVIRGGVLINDAVTTGVLKADAITSKHTITGATIQTLATASRGIKLTAAGNLEVWNAAGSTKTFEVIGSTGAVNGTGTWTTGTSGNFAELKADGSGGLLRFWTGNGTGRGNIYARDDVNGARMTLTFSDIDNPAITVPLIAVWKDRVNLSYGSMRMQVWDNAGTEEMLLDATGSKVTVRGNMDMRDGRTQYRYGSAAPLGYVGNRPESGTSADLEVRADTGGVRLTGSLITAFAVYNNTTASVANVNVDSGGLLKRVSSASRYKSDQQVMKLSDALLDIPVKDWLDKAAYAEKARLEALPALKGLDLERYNALVLDRIPGVIAEDVEKHEGERFVVYGQDGRTESVMYDRLAVAQIAVLKRQLDEAVEQIRELRALIGS